MIIYIYKNEVLCYHGNAHSISNTPEIHPQADTRCTGVLWGMEQRNVLEAPIF